ncbi:formate dehydrogenase accessory sulfurtransferase FdhD [Candidatus Bathyarchaeota archaeon]|nr:formate dehydrogenase accessory sulfurtransferase FdhD [Candidatus Bathyarchaeota archaeon]
MVTIEEPLHIFLNETYYASILCTPSMRRELVLGHLLSEGIIQDLSEVTKIQFLKVGKCNVTLKSGINLNSRITSSSSFARVVTTACGRVSSWPLSKLLDRVKLPEIKSNVRVNARLIVEACQRLNALAETFRETGGVHAAAIFSSSGDFIAFSEDVGRHNAVDKAIGAATIRRHMLSESFLTLTGRLSGDIVLKAARVKLPIVASLAAPLYSGVKIAKMSGVTLIGFVRGHRLNIYTHPKRVMVGK